MRNPEGVAEFLRRAESVCICCHVNPDGDTIGSALAMCQALTGMGKRAAVFCEDKVPDNLAFLPGAAEIRFPRDNREDYDLFLAVDVSDPARLGECGALKARCAHSAQIDHHGTNPEYTECNSVDGEASATCALIREQLRVMEIPLTREIAECLYTGISTDTGNFSFDCTDPEAFRVTAELVEAGLPLADLSMRLFREKDKLHLKVLGRAIERTRFEAEGRIAVMTLTQRDLDELGALGEHADNVVNYGLETCGTRMALLAREDGERIKFSLRSRAPLAVDGIAAAFGGGGHARAAGISIPGSLEERVEQVLQAMKDYLAKEEQ